MIAKIRNISIDFKEVVKININNHKNVPRWTFQAFNFANILVYLMNKLGAAKAKNKGTNNIIT